MNHSNVDEIKARLPIEELIGQYIKLTKAGRSFKANCPFHHEKTPSFFISPERGGYYCFGCGAKGDIFSFIEQFEGLDFKGALKVLADKAGVALVFDQKTDSERDRLFGIMEEAAKYFEAQLAATTGPFVAAAAVAREYIRKRGLSDLTRNEFRIGFAPEGWRNLYAYLREKKYPNDLIEKAGLAKKPEARSQEPGERLTAPSSQLQTPALYDRFRGRVMFPLVDTGGRVIGFTGRILKSDDTSAKYLNSPDTPIFDKSSVLYGLDKAKSFIRRLDYAILVEGQMDLIMSHQAGVKNTVAASGTALADAAADKNGVINNLGLLRRLSPNIIIAFDADAPGRKAAMRASGIGLSLEMNVKIADISGGKDPAELIQTDPEAWKNVLRDAKQVVEFEFDNVRKEVTEPMKLRLALQQRVYPLLLNIQSRTSRDFFVKMIADKTNIPAADIYEDLAVLKKRLDAENKTNAQTGAQAGAYSGSKAGSKTSAERTDRIDLVERRMFGLLDLMEKASSPAASGYRERIEKTAGKLYAARIERIQPHLADVSFEAEAIYGAEPERWPIHMDELIANFGEDLINQELIAAMNDLRAAERAGNQALVGELARKCQELSVRKAAAGKRER